MKNGWMIRAGNGGRYNLIQLGEGLAKPRPVKSSR